MTGYDASDGHAPSLPPADAPQRRVAGAWKPLATAASSAANGSSSSLRVARDPFAGLQAQRVRGRVDDGADVLLVCSTGGHLLELYALRDAWVGASRAWVTFDYSDARTLLKNERVFFAHTQQPRSPRNVVRNLAFAWRLMTRLRPKVMITTGAAVAVPFAWIGRARGTRVVYVESATRIDTPSLSCRLVHPFADRIFVQWPELLRLLPHAEYAGGIFSADR